MPASDSLRAPGGSSTAGAASPTRRRRPTGADVAARANVSRATVSFVLNNTPGQTISEETRRAVLNAAEELGYHPNRNAKSLASGKSTNLVCVVPKTQLGEPATALIGMLTAELSRRGYSMAVHFESTDHASLTALVQDLAPQMIFPLFGALPEWIDDDVAYGTALMPATQLPENARDAGVAAQVEHLAAAGHTRIGYVGTANPVAHEISEFRAATAQKVAQDAGVELTLSAEVAADGSDVGEVVRQAREAGVTALCAFSDTVAFMLLATLMDEGIACPEEIAVVGYDDVSLAEWSRPRLTTVQWDQSVIATLIADAVIAAVDDDPRRRTPAAEQASVDEVWMLGRAHVVARESA
ncbi:LacI family DNA-binding transcriptional regulator [Nesterenkonia sp. CL21]|uniref:LacI family DNA-binding transcriptional regulator n=1 Tax=unclassified Nesterenkonia TaxID=2629769 RepID=UPI002879B273|nr:LacI family DNA-binding transcriptional regulator [Nesterenkonia sp. CL21]MDS2173478.1 LacI family DNA-binding transcriptional regulator [Nesterenkonia sp. CL21]